MQNETPSDADNSTVRFPIGQLVATPSALRLLELHGILPLRLIARHIHGDWGNVPPEDAALNNEALKYGSRILSSYQVGNERVWIITEADRSSTTILLPDEY
jgi:hypothetical protein